MWRITIVVFIVSASALGNQEPGGHHPPHSDPSIDIDDLMCLPKCKVQEVKGFVRNCYWDTCTNSKTYAFLLKNLYTTDPNLGNFVYCWSKYWKLIYDSDPFDVVYRFEYLKPYLSDYNYKILVECGKIQHANKYKRALAILICYLKRAEDGKIFANTMKEAGMICAAT